MTKESRLKMRLRKLGKPRAGNPEKWKHTKESKEKNRLKHLGLKPSEKQLEGLKFGRGWNKGKKASKETLEKLRKSHVGKNLGNTNGFKKGHSVWKGKKRPNVSGENCNFWKGGICPINLKIRTGAEFKGWRLSVFERDKFLCQMPNCDKSERYLNAHHIKKFSDYPELRFDINNGITLCEKCHNKTKYKEEKFENLFWEIIKTCTTDVTVNN